MFQYTIFLEWGAVLSSIRYFLIYNTTVNFLSQ